MAAARQSRSGLNVEFRPRRGWLAAALVAALCGLIAVGLTQARSSQIPTAAAATDAGDMALYGRVVARVRHGEGYYAVAIDEQRRAGYPVRPSVAVRSPLLAHLLALMPGEASRRAALMALAGVVLAAWAWRLRSMRVPSVACAVLLLGLASGIALVFGPGAELFHETWAGLLIALSLALRRPGDWWPSLVVALLAAATRELAGAYLVAMAALAWRDGERREALAWLAGFGVFALGVMVHAAAVSALLRPSDPASQGWVRFGGWPFVLATLHWNLLLLGLPRWVGAIAGPLALLGLLGWRGPLGERVALTVLGYAAAFAAVGRPENSYWGVLIAPLWPLGLALAPAAVVDLVVRLRGSGRRRLDPSRRLGSE